MLELSNAISKYAGYIFGAIVLVFTGLQTWNLLYEVSGDALIATVGLIIFEGGMLYWLFTFLVAAEGLPQMALALLAATFSLALVGMAVGLHLGAVTAEQFGPNTPARLITIAALVNLIAKFLYPIVDPDQLKKIAKDAGKGSVMAKAYKSFSTKTDAMASALSDEMTTVWAREMQVDLFTANNVALPSGAVVSLPPANDSDRDPIIIVDADNPQDSADNKPPLGFELPTNSAEIAELIESNPEAAEQLRQYFLDQQSGA